MGQGKNWGEVRQGRDWVKEGSEAEQAGTWCNGRREKEENVAKLEGERG